MKPPPELVEALRRADSLALITHLNPDGDGLGCQAALAASLAPLGKRVLLANADPVPQRYAFLGLDRVPPLGGEGADLALVLDTSAPGRIGGAAEVLPRCRELAVVDHHALGTDGGSSRVQGDGGSSRVQGDGGGAEGAFARALRWVEPAAASAGSLVAALLEALGVALNPAAATALYAALAHDTGCFRHSNTDAASFELAARLKLAGADTESVNRELFESRPARSLALWARALADVKYGQGGRSALVCVSRALLRECGALPEDCDGIVEAARAVQGVELSALLREEPGRVKLSLRSKSSVDVNALAGRFGGGGHVRAAGATLGLPLAEAEAAVARALDEALSPRPS